MSTQHTEESHAIHIRDIDGKTLVYSADTDFSEVVGAFANGVDLFILECTFIRDKPIKKHLELAEAISLSAKPPQPRDADAFLSGMDDVDFAEEVGKFDPLCEVIEAKDGLRLTI